ncbi:MAG: AAA family ATPase [Cyanobacteria bacterium P01_E01_bin.42]
MKLDILEYTSDQGLPTEWKLEKSQLGQINLIVGKNASGKTRVVKIIQHLSEILSGILSRYESWEQTEDWYLAFNQNSSQDTIEYNLKIERRLVIQEKLTIGDRIVLERERSGVGTIFAEELDRDINFKIPEAELAVVKRQDSIQHSFLENIHQWENSLRFYEFGLQLDQNTLAPLPQKIEVFKKHKKFMELIKMTKHSSDCTRIIGIFVVGKKELGDRFVQAILKDMNGIGYNISKIGTKGIISSSPNLDYYGYPTTFLQSLYVQENDLNTITKQVSMSQGMFRALSLLIQVNYFVQSGQPGCIIVDDIGEGLDYQRSSALIKILIEKIEQAKTDSVQLIMTTNDEFIMNGVPLEYWSVIDRTSGHVKLHNIFNAKDKIEEFKFIGLNNFDFFTSEFHKQELSNEEE